MYKLTITDENGKLVESRELDVKKALDVLDCLPDDEDSRVAREEMELKLG